LKYKEKAMQRERHKASTYILHDFPMSLGIVQRLLISFSRSVSASCNGFENRRGKSNCGTRQYSHRPFARSPMAKANCGLTVA
jgi:hypothetical protein